MAGVMMKGAATTERAGRDGEASLFEPPAPGLLTVAHSPARELEGTSVEVGINAQDVLIGRDVAHGLILPDARASRLHARIVWDATQRAFRVGDADSSNGTRVNGARVTSARLAHGDVIRCGDSLLLFETEAPMEVAARRARRFARSKLSVLVQGETGTGKEVISRFIHDESGVTGDFVAVNCATLSKELAPAELFGHVRGAFSGATQSRDGLFVAADRGTLLLDEIGDLPLDVQPALLRVLEEGLVRPVGSDCKRSVDVRVIAATHLDLEAQARQGLFRPDLLGRLSQVHLHLPPLRQRRSQILGLARSFAEGLGFELELTADAAEALLLWDYEYNVRELKSLVRCLESRAGTLIDLTALQDVNARLANSRSKGAPEASSAAARQSFERRQQLTQELLKHGGNVSKVAQALGSDRAQIYRWMKALGVSAGGYRR